MMDKALYNLGYVMVVEFFIYFVCSVLEDVVFITTTSFCLVHFVSI